MASTATPPSPELLRDAFTRLIEHVDDLTDGLTDEVSRLPTDPERQQHRLVDLAQRAGTGHSAGAGGRCRAGVVPRRLGGPVRPGPAAQRHRLRARPRRGGEGHAPADLLSGYYHAVHKLTLEYIASVTADELARIVDTQLGSAGDGQRAVGEHHRRLRPAPRAGRLPAGDRAVGSQACDSRSTVVLWLATTVALAVAIPAAWMQLQRHRRRRLRRDGPESGRRPGSAVRHGSRTDHPGDGAHRRTQRGTLPGRQLAGARCGQRLHGRPVFSAAVRPGESGGARLVVQRTATRPGRQSMDGRRGPDAQRQLDCSGC